MSSDANTHSEISAAMPAARNSTDPLLIDAEEFGRLLKVSAKTIDRLLARKKLPRPTLLGRQRRWRRREIEEWVAAGMPDQREWDRLQRENERKQ